MMSCKEASELMSQALDIRLPLSRRIGLRIHVWLCTMCARYEKQLQFLQRAAARYAGHTAQSMRDDSALNPAAAQKIAQKIRELL